MLTAFKIASAIANSAVIAKDDGQLVLGRTATDNAREIVALCCLYRERVVLMSWPDAKACAAERSGDLCVSRPHVDTHEVFTAVWDGQDTFALKTFHNRFISQDTDGSLSGRAPDIDKAMLFKLGEPISNTYKKTELFGMNPPLPLISYNKNFAEREAQRFKAAARQLLDSRKPLIVLIGPGENVRDDALHISMDTNLALLKSGWLEKNSDKYFIFNADRNWGIGNSTVDFVYSEDVMEHMNQKSQIKILAEAHRVLRENAIHRVSAPCLLESMRVHSQFSLGADGVYEAEWDRWGHVALLSHSILKEFSDIVGYSRYFPAVKNHSISPYFDKDTRPSSDRNQDFGNVIADLVK